MDADPKPRPTYSVVHPAGSSARKRVEALPASTQRKPGPTESSIRGHSAGPRAVGANRPGRACAGLFDGQSGCAISEYFHWIWLQNSGLLPGLPEMVPDISGHDTELAEGCRIARPTITKPTGHSCRAARAIDRGRRRGSGNRGRKPDCRAAGRATHGASPVDVGRFTE